MLIIFCVCFCGCQKNILSDMQKQEKVENDELQESLIDGEVKETELSIKEEQHSQPDVDNAVQELATLTMAEEDKLLINKYSELVDKEKIQSLALVYLDEDDVPELLGIKNGEYRLYTYDGQEVKQIVFSAREIKANAYGSKYSFEEIHADTENYYTFFWFEYVPYKGLIRVHSGINEERSDYYLHYVDGAFERELAGKSIDYNWYTYSSTEEISNEEFLEQLSELGYDQLVTCGYLYTDVKAAYENMEREADTQQVWEDFLGGKTEAVYYAEEIKDIPEEGFVMRSYDELFEDMTAGDMEWGSYEYADFDNDGEEEMIIHGYVGSRMFLDVVGDTVYVQMQTGGTADNAKVAKYNGKNVIMRADNMHAGREYYWITKYDSCGCVVDWFCLSASYEGDEYTLTDKYMYRNEVITMEEFQALLESIQ